MDKQVPTVQTQTYTLNTESVLIKPQILEIQTQQIISWPCQRNIFSHKPRTLYPSKEWLVNISDATPHNEREICNLTSVIIIYINLKQYISMYSHCQMCKQKSCLPGYILCTLLVLVRLCRWIKANLGVPTFSLICSSWSNIYLKKVNNHQAYIIHAL